MNVEIRVTQDSVVAHFRDGIQTLRCPSRVPWTMGCNPHIALSFQEEQVNSEKFGARFMDNAVESASGIQISQLANLFSYYN